MGQNKPEDKDNDAPKSAVQWQPGPLKAKLGDLAEIDVPKGYIFADAANSKLFMKETGNLVTNTEYGTIAKQGEDWFVIFEFNESGYVKDDDQGELDADALLSSLQESNRAGNEERKKQGIPSLTIEGWFEKPHYDSASHNLVWATILRSEDGGKNINHNMRILGRKGVMSATLVAGQEQMQASLPEYNQLIKAYTYTPDNLYSAFKAGDKVAEYGLSALVLGGAAAAAVKTGLLKTILKFLVAGWKLVAVGLFALGAAIKKLFDRKKSEAAETAPAEDGTQASGL
jgi:uncharacterized membrane-anchored protein